MEANKIFKLGNGLVDASVFMPDGPEAFYRGVRFDRSGIFSGLWYRGHSFIAQWFEKYDPYMHDAVMGPVEDFVPSGFREAQPGESFLKPGVGLLVKPDNKVYTIRKLYETRNPGKWSVEFSEDRANFVHELEDAEWSYVYSKEIILLPGEPGILLRHKLLNTGRKIIDTSVYCHNFFVFDNLPVWPGTEILFPWEASGEGMGIGEGKFAEIGRGRIMFTREPEPGRTVYCTDVKGYGPDASDYDFRIENRIAGTGFRATCNRPLVRLSFWSCTATACPEPYISVRADPGQSAEWDIRYDFYLL